jgi:hypothetical protein
MHSVSKASLVKGWDPVGFAGGAGVQANERMSRLPSVVPAVRGGERRTATFPR